METARMVRSARRRASLTARDLAALAGVSPALVSRSESGKAVPSADTYRRLLRAAGFMDGGDWLIPLSRPSAVWTARWLLGDLSSQPDAASEWIEVWASIGLVVADTGSVRDPESLAFRAGRMAVLSTRPGSVSVSTSMLAEQLAARLGSTQIGYAISGDEALSRLGSPIVPSWPVVYVGSVPAAVDALDVRPVLPAERGPRALLIPFDGFSEVGRAEVNGVWFVSALQAVLDGYGGDGRMVEQAKEVFELRGWG